MRTNSVRIPLIPVFVLLFAPTLRAVDVEDLKPGLIAVYRDAAKPPVEITRLEPRMAVSWRAGESAHPRLAADGGDVRWEGYLNVLRAGNYRFGAVLRGKVKVSVGGQEVFAADVSGDAVETKQGPELRLESGAQPISVTFTRLPGTARFDLTWQGPNFPVEPMPHGFLFHEPEKLPAKLAADNLVERGRFVVEEMSCVRCHKPAGDDKLAAGLAWRQGPDLSAVGGRVYHGWMYHWLLDPQKVRPGAAMPRMFADDEKGRVEAYAVASYLASLGGPLKDPGAPQRDDKAAKEWKQQVDQGRRAFVSVGCITCHNDLKTAEPQTPTASGAHGASKNFPLGALGSKLPEKQLAAYLQSPLTIDPSGRMPRMLIDGKDLTPLARYLIDSRETNIAAEPPKPQGNESWVELGKRLVIAKNCSACHTIEPGKKPLPEEAVRIDWAAVQTEKSLTKGCLADVPAQQGVAPAFALDEADRKAVRRFLQEGTKGAGSPAPAQAARVTLHRFNCLACHSRNGKGGLSAELTEELRRYEKVENAEALTPPPLTGVGEKLRTSWLKQVLTQAGRARPWMGLHMPQFGDANVGHLAEGLALLDASEPDDKVHAVPLTPQKIEAGRTLSGKTAFGCVSCHDIAGIPNTGTRGPDLALMNQRVRYDWYRRWMNDAQRITPGTRMPTVFPNNRSNYDKLYGGDGAAQSEAMWGYFSLGPTLPLPDGMDPPKGLTLTVKDKPYLLRTFMPDAGSRSVAVGYPGGISVTFDAATCRLVYAWSGNFLDASPVWDGRGGNPANLLGPKFWTSPPGCAWGTGNLEQPPDFAARAKDPAFGAPVQESQAFQGVKQLHYLGYGLDADGVPTFKYRLGAEDVKGVEVAERPEPIWKSGVAVGVRRKFTVANAGTDVPWLLVGETTSDPRLVEGQGKPLFLIDTKKDRQELPYDGRLVVLPQGGGRSVVVSLAEAPREAVWMLAKRGAAWQLLVRLPSQKGPHNVTVDVWSPYRDDAGLLRGLLAN